MCKQIAELAQEICLYQYCPTVTGLMLCSVAVPARVIILSASSWGIFKSCWLSDWFLWENYDISGNFIWGEMNAWLAAVTVNCRCCIKTPQQIKTCHSVSLHSLPYFILPSTLNMQRPRVPSLQGMCVLRTGDISISIFRLFFRMSEWITASPCSEASILCIRHSLWLKLCIVNLIQLYIPSSFQVEWGMGWSILMTNK